MRIGKFVLAFTLFFGFVAFANDDSTDIGTSAINIDLIVADNRRKDRRDDRGDNRDGKQECRQEEGRVGDDKRECKQENRGKGDGDDDEKEDTGADT